MGEHLVSVFTLPTVQAIKYIKEKKVLERNEYFKNSIRKCKRAEKAISRVGSRLDEVCCALWSCAFRRTRSVKLCVVLCCGQAVAYCYIVQWCLLLLQATIAEEKYLRKIVRKSRAILAKDNGERIMNDLVSIQAFSQGHFGKSEFGPRRRLPIEVVAHIFW